MGSEEKEQSNENQMIEEKKDPWVYVKHFSYAFRDKTIYINPLNDTAKVEDDVITYWGYHDESEHEVTEHEISIETAIATVYPDRNAIETILKNTQKDYTAIVERLDEEHRIPESGNTEGKS